MPWQVKIKTGNLVLEKNMTGLSNFVPFIMILIQIEQTIYIYIYIDGKPLTMKGEYWNKDILQCYIGHINVADVKLKNA